MYESFYAQELEKRLMFDHFLQKNDESFNSLDFLK